jgi:hypothetical protein
LLRILPQQPLHALDIPSLHSLTEVLTWTRQVTESPFWAQSVVNCRCEGSWFACLNAWLPMAARSSWRFLLRWELGSKFERLKCGLLAVCNLLWRAKQNESSVCQKSWLNSNRSAALRMLARLLKLEVRRWQWKHCKCDIRHCCSLTMINGKCTAVGRKVSQDKSYQAWANPINFPLQFLYKPRQSSFFGGLPGLLFNHVDWTEWKSRDPRVPECCAGFPSFLQQNWDIINSHGLRTDPVDPTGTSFCQNPDPRGNAAWSSNVFSDFEAPFYGVTGPSY